MRQEYINEENYFYLEDDSNDELGPDDTKISIDINNMDDDDVEELYFDEY